MCEDHVRLLTDQFSRKRSCPFNVRGAPPNIHPNIPTIGPTQLSERSREAGKPEGSLGIIFDEPHEHAHTPHPIRLLCARRERPCDRRAAEQRDEVAAFYLIELHSVPSTRTGFCMISNWQSSVSGYRGRFATGEELSTATAAEGWTLLNAYGRRVADVPDAQCDYSRAAVP
jgi:hypothetical protein